MIQFFTLLMVILHVYLPVNAWITHDNGVASPLSYIGLGLSLYFWLLVLVQFLTPKNQRKIYSELDLDLLISELTNELNAAFTNNQQLNEGNEETKH